MKTFKQYLAESAKPYSYRIKIAGDLAPEVLDSFKKRLAKYEPDTFSDPKKTPVQKSPAGFPELANQEIHIMDGVFNYPASQEEITELWHQSGGDPNHIRVIDSEYDDSVDNQVAQMEEGPLLEKDFPDASKESQQASESYSQADVIQNSAEGADFEIAGGNTPAAPTTNDLPQGNKSPIGGTNKIPDPYKI